MVQTWIGHGRSRRPVVFQSIPQRSGIRLILSNTSHGTCMKLCHVSLAIFGMNICVKRVNHASLERLDQVEQCGRGRDDRACGG